jgi:GT2 family glycosyltransferase
VIQAFGLNEQSGRHLPFFFWKDEKLIGPERAFEQCWNQVPGRDVIIVHTDMRPMPQDPSNGWYAALCAQAEQLPDAGLIGCDLLYPLKSPTGRWYVQCAGGYFKDGMLGHIGGGVSLIDGVATQDAYEYDERFSKVRSSQWVTFGGVYIRRTTIDMVGAFDLRYQWAYVMDVDFCLEAHVRGQGIYQVPINLLHEESKTSKKFLVHPEYRAKQEGNVTEFYKKWAWYLERSEKQRNAASTDASRSS